MHLLFHSHSLTMIMVKALMGRSICPLIINIIVPYNNRRLQTSPRTPDLAIGPARTEEASKPGSYN